MNQETVEETNSPSEDLRRFIPLVPALALVQLAAIFLVYTFVLG